ncbi:sugar ABC transporter substrate-binding protein [Vibrio quintilis]|uniref:Autoinducer 2-binding periplasmic protein LuxP n=1 Tax=Vibrio quintilis TaxID=1117707 RepID=A0A1M7YS34_9VIBR|nr:sugar ABC transporter substrate-binding protein [Vibrio quintilis]SHO55428.1 D-ribose-binding periplasmic protein precursor [Vibrio quintilis]
MHVFKQFIRSTTAIFMTLLMLTGYAQAERYIYVTHGQVGDSFWDVVKNGAETAAKELGVTLDYRSPAKFSGAEMAKMINEAAAGKPDGIVVSIPDADALGDAIQGAVAKGIPVISINSGEDFSSEFGAIMHIGQSEYAAAEKAGIFMKKEGVSKGVCVNQEPDNVGLTARCDGFIEGLEGEGEVLNVSTDPAQIESAVAAYLKSNPDVNGVLTLATLAAGPAQKAIMQANSKAKLATFDLSADVLQSISQGKILFALDQQQYLQGYMPLVILHNYNRAALLPSENVQTGPNMITQDKADAVISYTKQKMR